MLDESGEPYFVAASSSIYVAWLPMLRWHTGSGRHAAYSARRTSPSHARHTYYEPPPLFLGVRALQFVMLLRLSPLLPLSVSNYLYGLTSVDLVPYIFGTMLGMAPGTYAYVSAGHIGKAVLAEAGEGSAGIETWPAVRP